MKSLFKKTAHFCLLGLGVLAASPITFLEWAEKRIFGSQYLFILGAQTLALFPGLFGNYLRAGYYFFALESFHNTAIVSFGSYFSSREGRIGARSGIGDYCIIGKAHIGENVRIASRVSIVSGLHEHGTAQTWGEGSKGQSQVITIGSTTWIGEGAIVGQPIGSNSIIGLGAIVLRPVPDDCIAMAPPARLLPR